MADCRGRFSGESGRSGHVTLHDVAALAEVSIATVSHYLSGNVHVSKPTGERVQRAIDALGYVPNSTARNLKTERTRMFTLSVSDLRQPYYSRLASEIIDAAQRRGYGVVVHTTGLNRDRAIEGVASVRRRVTDGLIISPSLLSDRDVGLFRGAYPLVVAGNQMYETVAPTVSVDNVSAAYDATMHLLSVGCRHVALIAGGDSSKRDAKTLRFRGYCKALHDSGVTFDDRLVRDIYDWTVVGGEEAVTSLLDLGMTFDGILAGNDLLALGAIQRLRERGIRVPDDVRVVGFDNSDQGRYVVPSLTSVDLECARVAEESVKCLIDQIEQGRRPDPLPTITVRHTVVYRDSSPESE